MMLTSASACSFSVRQDSDISTQGTASVYVIDMSEEQINIKIVQTVEKSPGHSNKEEVGKAWLFSPDRLTSRELKRTRQVEHTTQ
jgi:hypothetical protein